MIVTTTSRRLDWFAELLEPWGLRWNAEQWFTETRLTASRGRCNVVLPPDGWRGLLSLATAQVHGERGFRRPGVKSYQMQGLTTLSRAIANRYSHPAFSKTMVPVSSTITPAVLPAWKSEDGTLHPFGSDVRRERPRMVLLQPEVVTVETVGQCWTWRVTEPRTHVAGLDHLHYPEIHTLWIDLANRVRQPG